MIENTGLNTQCYDVMKIRPSFQNLVSSFIVYRSYFIDYTVFIFIIFNVTMLFFDFRSGRTQEDTKWPTMR